MHVKEYFEIARPLNCIMAALAVFIGASVAFGGIDFSFPVLLAMISAFLICGAGQAINDFFDYEIDRKKDGRAKTIKKLGRKNVLYYSIILFLAGNSIAYFINPAAFGIALAFSILLIAYSAVMGRIKFIGNWVVASGTAATLIFGASVWGNYSLAIQFAAAALFANVAREITKDFEDLKADEGFKRSLPMVVGARAEYFASFLYAAAFMVGINLWIFGAVKSWIYMVLIFASGIIFLLSAVEMRKGNFSGSQRLGKYGMLTALLAFMASVVS